MSGIKYASLFALTAQNSFLSILLQGSAAVGYSPATVVLVTEILKGFTAFVIAFVVAWHSGESELGVGYDRIRACLSAIRVVSSCIYNSADSWKLGVPAALYVIGNNVRKFIFCQKHGALSADSNQLQFVGAANLDLPTFQVTYNLKILTTAILSVIVLKKQLTGKQWLALCLLVLGVTSVQISASTKSNGGQTASKQPLVGLVAILIACCTSGFAGVYFEKVLKGTQTDLWSRNIQMSFFSLLPALFTSMLSTKPILINFGWMALAVVATQALGGLITAVVIKYADNILKGFAAALAVFIAAVVGVLFFNFSFSIPFAFGSTLVISATFLYAAEDQLTPPKSLPIALDIADDQGEALLWESAEETETA